MSQAALSFVDLLTRLAEHQPLGRAEAYRAMQMMLSGEATPEQIAAFLLGLRSRGETAEELTGLTEAMREVAVQVDAPPGAIDIVGTGGDRSGSFNISTTTAFVCAGAGAIVAKHGNRSVSSKCGSADVLEVLGVKTELGKQGVEHCLQQAGIAFIFAPYFHPTLKHVMPVRRSLGVRTCFNILGPLCNPAGVTRQLIGAFSSEVAEIMAQILINLGSEHVFCVHAHDGLDELSLSGPTTVYSATSAAPTLVSYDVVPADFGLKEASLSHIIGGNASENAAILLSVLRGEAGPKQDIVLLNAGFALVAAGKATSATAGIELARESIASGKALESLERLVAASHEPSRGQA
ncbi:anthranilate phosphoribosyltransferase [bacterium]|nr:anthranilate phosphoribosyltransferase [bacterium]